MVISDLEDYLNITEPCRLCRKESVPISGDNKYCLVCYKELITNAIQLQKVRS